MDFLFVSIDVGSLFIKASFFTNKGFELGDRTDIVRTPYSFKYKNHKLAVYLVKQIKLGKNDGQYRDARGIINSLINDLKKILNLTPTNVYITGRGKEIADEKAFPFISDFKAITEFFKYFYTNIASVFEIGAENSKYISFGDGFIEDYETNGECAAGTGSFLDQQARRLKFETEEIAAEALSANRVAYIAGRCSVFAKSDMIHAQQKGYTPQEILMGLSESIAENYKANILKAKKIKKPIAFVGGVALNEAVYISLKKVLNLKDEELVIPDYPSYIFSIGALSLFNEKFASKEPIRLNKQFPLLPKLNKSKVIFLRDKVQNLDISLLKKKTNAFLGIDIGSVSTNLVLINEDGIVLKEIYLRTAGRPIDAVNQGLAELSKYDDKIQILGVGTTGSGRELIGELVGADFIKDEITAHNKGSSFVSRKYFSKPVETIFEIGGQDSKFISIRDEVVIDFHMNEACSAGTGSFLEEQAEKLGVKIKGEFADLAMSATSPINLGDRCTVFIEKDLNSYYEQGAKIEDLLAGLSYSIVHNYLNRVVKGRELGETIYFQGGTAYNDAVASAFASVLDKTIIVPPHNGVMGALGMALISLEKYKIKPYKTSFKTYDLSSINYTLREFTCKACANQCTIQEFSVDGKKTYWGDKCSDRFRKTTKTNLKPSTIDFIEERNRLLFYEYNKRFIDVNKRDRVKIGFPRAMYFWDRLPFWSVLIDELGYDLVLSDPSSSSIAKNGSGVVISEPCFPIKLAHGHVLNLMDKGVDYILIPAMINAEPSYDKKTVVGRPQFYFCPWGQTLSSVIKNNERFSPHRDKLLEPKLELREGDNFVINDLYKEFKKHLKNISKTKVKMAYFKAKKALEYFRETLYKTYYREIVKLKQSERELILLVGRPYNINDSGLNLNIARKLRDNYGVNVLPMDYIPTLDRTDEITDNMFWNYGRKILSVLREVADKDNIHPIYITNFECGPDSYIKHFVSKALKGKSLLVLQFDEHGNDAGILTRCEAYLDSKGVFDYYLYHKSENIEERV